LKLLPNLVFHAAIIWMQPFQMPGKRVGVAIRELRLAKALDSIQHIQRPPALLGTDLVSDGIGTLQGHSGFS
jgi:hypothetical protein